MTTSLAQQLKKLYAPQTALLGDSRSRASILFDAKDAATKDRDTIFEIGLSGLEELIAMNPQFKQFETTLFDRSSINLERAVESKEVNKNLSKNIKRFLLHLSPFFMLQPAHQCLEWLIRRFSIHLFDEDEFLRLVLPYHETRMFVRCVQVMKLRLKNIWLVSVKTSGLPLSVQAVHNYAAANPEFLERIGDTLKSAISELGNRAHTLQTLINFYCTTVVGALHFANQVNDSQIVRILPALLKGYKSPVIDYASSVQIITVHLVHKTTLSPKLVDVFVQKLCGVVHPSIRSSAVLALMNIFQQQPNATKNLSNNALETIVGVSWMASIIAELYASGVKSMDFVVGLLAASLRNVQMKEHGWMQCKELCERLVREIVFNNNDVEAVIRTVLSSYVMRQRNNDEVILLDSDDESKIALDDTNVGVSVWYSDFLKSLQRQYPAVFDKVTTDVMKTNGDVSEGRRSALKAVLGFLLKISLANDETSVFENLYHYKAESRSAAVRHLVKCYSSVNGSPEEVDLLKDAMRERLNDDSPAVVAEVLQMSSRDLVELVGGTELETRLLWILNKYQRNRAKWAIVIKPVVTLVTSIPHQKPGKIFQSLLYLMFPKEPEDIKITTLICYSDYAKSYKFYKLCAIEMKKLSKVSVSAVNKAIKTVFNQTEGFPSIEELIEVLITRSEHCELYAGQVCYDIMALTSALPVNCHPTLALIVLKYVVKVTNALKCVPQENINDCLETNSIPLTLVGDFLKKVIIATDWSNLCLSGQAVASQDMNVQYLAIGLFDMIVTNYATSKHKKFFSEILSDFFSLIFHNFDQKMEFLSIFFVAHCFNTATGNSFNISPELQLRGIRLTTSIITNSQTPIEFSQNVLLRMLISLTNEYCTTRDCAIESIEAVLKNSTLDEKYSILLKKLIFRKEEISLDREELALGMFSTIFPAIKSKSVESVKLNRLLNDLVTIVADLNTPKYLSTAILEMLKHINTPEILNTISPVANSFLQDVNQIDELSSKIINLTLSRVDAKAMKAMTKMKNIEMIVMSAVNTKKLINSQSPCCQLLDSIDEEVFDNIPDTMKEQFVEAIVNAATFCSESTIQSSATKFLKMITLDGNIVARMLTAMCKQSIMVDGEKSLESVEVILTDEWKRGITLLELLQIKSNVTNLNVVLTSLYEVLAKCLRFEIQTSAEYTKQMLLACLLHCSQKMTVPKKTWDITLFQVEPVVQSIRTTQNPQTHHHALLLLCHLAEVVPDRVLHHIVEIFTFMGSAIVRHDYSYTFQIIAKIIETVIPTLIRGQDENKMAENVIPVLRVFANIMLDVPEYRRIPLFVKLIQTLNPLTHFWTFLGVVFAKEVSAYDENSLNKVRKKDGAESEDLSPRMQIAFAIASEFEPDVVINACTQLIEYLVTLPDDCPDDLMELDNEADLTIFSVAGHSSRQLRYLKYTILQFISYATSSTQFVNKVAMLSDTETKRMKPFYQNMIIKILTYIPAATKSADPNINSNHMKSWKVMLHHCYDILDSAISLLSGDMFLLVVHGLMKHKIPTVRKKVIELLINKLQHKVEFFDKCDVNNMQLLLDPLMKIIASIEEDDIADDVTHGTQAEKAYLQQIALIAVKLLSRILAAKHVDVFKGILEKLIVFAKKYSNLHKIYVASICLCVSEICANLRVHAIVYLPEFMPLLLKILSNQMNGSVTDVVMVSLITSAQKIIETLPLFMSPYLTKLLRYISSIKVSIDRISNKDPRANVVVEKINSILSKISSVVPLRVLVPAIERTHESVVKDCQYDAIIPLMTMLGSSFAVAKGADIASHQKELCALFQNALSLRSDNKDNQIETIDVIEGAIVNAYVGMILKLSESSFRPLFFDVYSWATKDPEHKDRMITFYRLASNIADSLKSLFVLFANEFIQHAADTLDACNSSKIEDPDDLFFPNSTELRTKLIENIIQTLSLVFLHDNQQFINAHRFDILMQPIVDQLENPTVLESADTRALLAPCIAQLATAIGADALWKQLNYQVLMKTRTNSSEIRLFALSVCVEMAKKLGDNFTPLLPDTVPFFAELLEDENPEVERACQKAVQELERILQEPLQQYF